MGATDTSDADRARRAIALIDLTDLNDDSTEDAVVALCARAAEHGTAAVCVWPDFVATAVAELAATPVRIATVVNFPTGDERPFAVSVLTERVVADGADDVDVVLPYRTFATGERDRAAHMLQMVRAAAADVQLKVILETGELNDVSMIADASQFAIHHGADFIKTSTGKSPVSASLTAASAMLDVIAKTERPIGLKPSGGIRSFDDAMAYLDLADDVMGAGWATPDTFRFGASGVLDALLAIVGGDASSNANEPGGY